VLAVVKQDKMEGQNSALRNGQEASGKVGMVLVVLEF
jgi:hypothetical protein